MAGLNSNSLNWHFDILPRATKRALEFLAKAQWLKRLAWYLAGGTALALQLGHRQSVDLDFFTPKKDFSNVILLNHFRKNIWATDIMREGTIYGRLLGAKVSFIAYPFFCLKEPSHWYGAIKILSPREIAIMKIIAISQRGKKRDFIDLYWYIMHHDPLIKLLKLLPEYYPTVAHDYHHIAKSLVYFVDADVDPMPKVLFKADWRKIKAYFVQEVPKVTKGLLDLQ